jgi:hypothetical protein
LFGGWPAALLVSCELQLEWPTRARRKRIDALARKIARTLENEDLNASLYFGFPGLLWLLAAYSDTLPEDMQRAVEESGALDDLIEALRRHQWGRELDVLRGVIGVGLLFLESREIELRRRGVEAVCDELAEQCVWSSQGALWPTPFELLPNDIGRAYPNGYLNCGMAHGQTGVLAFLIRAAETIPDSALVREMIGEGVRYLLSLEGQGGPHCALPRVLDRRVREHGRLAWCYGDLGAALTINRAARWLNRPYLHVAAQRLVIKATTVAPDHVEVYDACLCHGAAGLAYLFGRAHAETECAAAALAAAYWTKRALEYRRSRAMGGGFLAQLWEPEAFELVPDGGFLNGAAGVVVALLSTARTSPERWDRLLLTDAVRRPHVSDERHVGSGLTAVGRPRQSHSLTRTDID